VTKKFTGEKLTFGGLSLYPFFWLLYPTPSCSNYLPDLPVRNLPPASFSRTRHRPRRGGTRKGIISDVSVQIVKGMFS
jgi:hypothetical protein